MNKEKIIEDILLGNYGATAIYKIVNPTNPEAKGYLVVERDTLPELSDEIGVFYFGDYASAMVTPDDFKKLLKNKIKMAHGWVLGEKLYDINEPLMFLDAQKFIDTVKDYPYRVESYDDPLRLLIGFRCPVSNRSWMIRAVDIKKTSKEGIMDYFKSKESKDNLLTMINEKPLLRIRDEMAVAS